MQPIIQNKIFTLTTPRTRLNSTEQTITTYAKQISTESLIPFLDPKFYRHEHMTKIEFYKNSQNFLRRKLFITIKVYLTSIK